MNELILQQAIGGVIGGLLNEFCKPENMRLISESLLGTGSSSESVSLAKSPVDAAIVALKAYKNGVLSKDQALRICAIALEDSGKTVDVDSVAILEKLFR